MLVYELIKNDLKPLQQHDTVVEAVSVMEDRSMSYYPVVDAKGYLVGEASLSDLKEEDAKKLKKTLDSRDIPSNDLINQGQSARHFLRESDHILEAARTMLLLNRSFLPVVDRNENYLGTVTKVGIMDAVIRLLNLRDAGTVIMIEMNARDYMLSDVIRIIEAEGARILAMTVQAPDAMNEHFRISVKLNLDDLARVGSSLRRYGYLITSESHSELTDSELSDKADEFFRYLDI